MFFWSFKLLSAIPSVLLGASFQFRLLHSSCKSTSIHIFYLHILIFYKSKCFVNLSNLENVLQGNLRKDRAREYIFKASGGTHFENFSTPRQSWWHLQGFHVCTSLPKKTLDTSLTAICKVRLLCRFNI